MHGDEHNYVAHVVMTHSTRTHFRFIDCMATYVRDEGDPEGGYGETVERGRNGVAYDKLSYVAGLVGGSIECHVYPEQFDLPFTKGEVLRFFASQQTILEACVRALVEERCPPEYHI